MPRSTVSRLLVPALVVGLTATGAVLGTRWAAAELAPARCTFSAADREVRLTPEQAANAATIAAVAVRRGLPPRAATIALATAIQESKLRNLRYGDADSQGLFQQRPSQGWGTVEQVTDPVYASDAFYDALVEVRGWDEGVVTEVAQEVQRSAFPDAYADHEWEGRVLASVLTGQEGAGTALDCRLGGRAGTGSAQEVADKAAAQLGLTGRPDGRLVLLEAGDPARAWAAATWAVSHAQAEEIVRVQVQGRVWDRASGTWSDADDDGAANGSPTTVVVEVG
ncbi:hypothetical protein AVL62_06965 [Serinicoccus chungangensis]|uniref:Heavy metal transporter n=1 Tax=Serinicoccus chungangensis TaxID=767452 RepID=A0A0W8IHC2_9MICO|nr:hypothetical protein [Serinicoccus chungangensis]KUG59406.1 hypothetical protein AVL62_06965 [Serinicoccus chungangensis]